MLTAREGLFRLKAGVYRGLAAVPGAIAPKAEENYLRNRRAAGRIAALRGFDAALAALPPGALCIDLGANLGTVTARLADAGAEVHAFEPDPWTFEKLSAAVGDRPGVTLHNAAAGCEESTLTLSRHPDFASDPERYSQAGTLLGPDASGAAARDRETVEVRCIDFIAFLRALDRDVAILKIDIEGAEVALLDRLLGEPELARIGTMFVETHEVPMPHLRARTEVLRRRLAALDRPRVHLDWP